MKLWKLPLLLITFLLIFSCGRNVEADFNTLEDVRERFNILFVKEKTKEVREEWIELLSELEEIFSYYVNDANNDETQSFIRLINDGLPDENWEPENREDLKKELDAIKRDIKRRKEYLDKWSTFN